MKILKHISLYILLLSGVSCWSMQNKETVLSFDDMDINHEDAELFDKETGDFCEEIILTHKETQIGHLVHWIIHISKEDDILKKFIYEYVVDSSQIKDSADQKKVNECLTLFKNCSYIIKIDTLKIYDTYQKNGLGKLFLDYYSDHIQNNYKNAVVCFMPAQSFARQKNGIVYSPEELQERLITFYKRFGAEHLPSFPEWMYIKK